MSSTVNINMKTAVHKQSSGMAIAFPDVCKTPAPPAPPIPIPYPNIASSSDTAMGTKTVKIQGSEVLVQGGVFATSTGDEAGSVGGVASNCIKGKAEPVNYSFDVKLEGKNAVRLMDPMVHNKGSAVNTPPTPELQPPLVPPICMDSDPEEIHSLSIDFLFTGSLTSAILNWDGELKGPKEIKKKLESSFIFEPQLPSGSFTLQIKKPDFDKVKRSNLKADY